MGWVMVAVAALGGTALLWLIFRSREGGTTTRLGPDGFFVRGSFEPGARVRYKVRVNGKWKSGEAAVSGDETFVYTGATPTEVEIVDVIGGAAPISSPPSSPPSPPSSDDSSPFGGFPSAY